MNYVGPVELSLRTSRPAPKPSKDLPSDVLPIFACDPGGTTGWSLMLLPALLNGNPIFNYPQEVVVAAKKRWWHGEINCYEEDYGVYQLIKILEQWPSAAVIFEDFFVRQMAVDLSPIRIISKVEYYLWTQGRRMLKQQAGHAKPAISNERMKVWGIYTSEHALQHARDADRHAFFFMRRCLGSGNKARALRKEAFPNVYG